MNVSPTSTKCLRVAEVARQLDVDERTIRRWIARGELKSVRIGRVVLIREADLIDRLR